MSFKVPFIAAIIHSVIAYFVHVRVKDLYPKLPGDHFSEGLLDLLAFLVIDGTIVLCKVNRQAVRAWHWKVNAFFAIIILIVFFSHNLVRDTVFLVIPLFTFVYLRLRKEGIGGAYRVGLEKYQRFDPDYEDISWARNYKYPLITLAEATLIFYFGWVTYLSPLLFVIIDAIWNRITGQSRTKVSDLYVSIFSASMDTGLYMALFNFPTIMRIEFDLAMLLLYLVMLHGYVRFQDKTVKDTYEILNENWTRMGAFITFMLGCWISGYAKNMLIILTSNLLANMLFVWLSQNILLSLKP